MIDLQTYSSRIIQLIGEAIESFTNNPVNARPTCVALYSSPVSGWVSLCINMTDSNLFPPASCPDFTYPNYRRLEFPEWRAERNSEHPTIRRHDSQVVVLRPDDSESRFNEAVFLWLMRVWNDRNHSAREGFRPIWCGVQIQDTDYCSFWRVYQKRAAPPTEPD